MSRGNLFVVAALLPALVAGVGCDDISPSDEPPELVVVQLDCGGGFVEATVHTRDATGVSTVAVTPQSDGAESHAAFLDIEYTDLSVERWQFSDIAHDCDVPVEFVVSATNVWGQTTEASHWWPEVDPELEGVVPPHGPDLGGTVATIHGEDLAFVSSVRFDGAEATILSTGEEAVEVEVPPGVEGSVDVLLTIQGADTVLEDAFTYYPDASSLYGGLLRAQVFLYDTAWYTIGSAYGPIDYGPFFQVELALHEPIPREQTFFGNTPTPGDCEWGTGAGWTNLDAGNYALLEGPTVGAPVLVNDAPDSLMYVLLDDNLDYGLYDRELFSVDIQGGTDIPAQNIPDALQMPPLLTDPDLDFLTAYTRTHGEDVTLTWTPDSSILAVGYRIYASRGSAPLSSVYCTAPGADGTATVAWDELVAGIDESQVNGLHFEIDVLSDTQTILEHDHSILWAQGSFKHWVYAPLEAAP